MNTTGTHSIGKLSFHLKGVDAGKAFAMRQQAATYLQHDFLRLAEEVFDEFEMDDELVFIQQLKIDLQLAGGTFDLKEQEQRLREQIRRQLQKQIRKQLFSAKENQQPITANEFSTAAKEIPDGVVFDENVLLQTWAFYLEYGYLPAHIPISVWQERLSWWKKTFVKSGIKLKEFFILQLRDEQRLKRFLKNETEKVKKWIIDQLHHGLYSLLEAGRVKRNQQIAFSFFEQKTYLSYLLAENNATLLMSEAELPAVDWVMQHHETFHKTAKHSSTETKESSEKKTIKLQQSEGGIIVHNAGIVLLQPFITTLFNELHLLSEDRKLITDKQKACALLSFLAGDEEQDEIYFPLYKLLCGTPMDELIDNNVYVTIEEREECFRLLQQVILHWPALKQSSVPSLQQTFLQRIGKLSHKEDRWLLQVEQRTEDVLMQYLPWSYSIIRYPWMKQALFVEWT